MALIHRRAFAVMGALGLLLLGTVFVAPARATHVQCGQVITESVWLDSDVGPCPGDGLIVAASGITVNLNGFAIRGANGPNETAGIRLRRVNKVTVTNGEIKGFDAGLVIGNGSQNIIRGLEVHHNDGNAVVGTPPAPACNLGDGIVGLSANNNVIQDNTVHNNGPFSGISMVGPSSGNLIRNNHVHANNIYYFPCGNFQNIGIRLEGPGAVSNVVDGNRVELNGLHGVHVHSTDPAEGDNLNRNNKITNNFVFGNGYGPNRGHGIALGIGPGDDPDNNTVKGNFVRNNSLDGIHVVLSSINNAITNNQASGNGRWDGADLNPNCDNNLWEENVFVTVNQPCVLDSR